jgi:PmbA protein
VNDQLRTTAEEIKQRQAELEQKVAQLLEEAKRQGASSAAAAINSDTGLSVTVRMGEVETIEHTRDNSLGITVYFGKRKGSASTSDLHPDAIKQSVKAACDVARYTCEDEYTGLADADLMAQQIPELDIYHPWMLAAEEAILLGQECETAARTLDPRISNSEGATINSNSGLHIYGNSHGFIGGYPSSHHSISCSVIGQQGGAMQRDYWYTVGRAEADMEAPISVGRRAAERTLARLGARKIGTRQAPVLFQAEVATSLLGGLIRAISGNALYRNASFLRDHLGQQIFPDFVQIDENPLLLRGLASAPFDSEGVATKPRNIVTDGTLQGYILSSYSARKLGMQTTGNGGGVRNIAVNPGSEDLPALLRKMDRGLLVTEMMGSGVNIVTGDYSRGASGFWVEGGEIQFPVEEITIAGNLREMFQQLIAVGSDEECRGTIRTGSWLIENMMIAGD